MTLSISWQLWAIIYGDHQFSMSVMAMMAMMAITSQFVEWLVEGWGGPYHPIILSSRRDTTNKEFLLSQQESLN